MNVESIVYFANYYNEHSRQIHVNTYFGLRFESIKNVEIQTIHPLPPLRKMFF